MMASVAPSYSPHPAGLQQHPGAPPHPMAGIHPQQGVPPGQGMPQQAFQMAVSGPGVPHMTQPGAMMGGMPPGIAGPGGPNAHAMQHLNPNQAMFQQQQQQQQLAFANNPQMQQLAAQQQMMQQRTQQQAQARQAMLAQQQFGGGMPMNMNGMNPGMNAAQFAQMRQQGPRPPVGVPLPAHLQQLQQDATQHSQQQAQAQLQHQQQQQQHQQQLLAMQMQNAAHGGQPGPNQMNPQQMQLRQMAVQQQQQAQQQAHLQQQQQQQQQQAQQQAQATQQQAQQQQAHEQQQQQAQHQQQVSQEQAAAAVAARQSQVQAQQQQNQANPQAAQAPGPVQQAMSNPQQQAMNPAMMNRLRMQQQQQQMQPKLPSILRLISFGDSLGQYINSTSKPPTDLSYWNNFVSEYFSPSGVFRHVLWMVDEAKNKQFEISYPAIARYFNTHFDSGVTNMQLIVQAAVEKDLPNQTTHISSEKSSFIYWFENRSQLVAHGKLKVIFNDQQKIELLEFETTHHEEYLPRGRVVEAARPLHEWQKEWQRLNTAPDGKQSPELNKKGKPRPMKSPNNAPPEIDIPESKVKANMGITPGVFRFLELAEVMGQMNPLFAHSHSHTALRPYVVLDQYVEGVARQQSMNPAMNPNINPNLGQRAASGAFSSPANNQIPLPDGSTPGMMMQGSPAIGNMAAPPMQMQQSQQGSSSGMSANTSPNVNNKRRRMSVKDEEGAQVNGTGPQGQMGAVPAAGQAKVKPSPRIGGKRQKGAPA